MLGLNKVSLIGHIGRDPEFRELDKKISVARFDLATTEFYRNQQSEMISRTEWHSIILWRGLADLTKKHLKGGSMVFIEGRLRSRVYEGKEGGVKKVVEVVADKVIMLDKPRKQKESK